MLMKDLKRALEEGLSKMFGTKMKVNIRTVPYTAVIRVESHLALIEFRESGRDYGKEVDSIVAKISNVLEILDPTVSRSKGQKT